MDNAQKAIMIGVGLFITIIIISVVLLITNLGTDIADQSTETLEGLTTSMRQQLALEYDGKTNITRNQVIDAATRYQNMTGLTITIDDTEVSGGADAMGETAAGETFTGSVTIDNNGNATVDFATN